MVERSFITKQLTWAPCLTDNNISRPQILEGGSKAYWYLFKVPPPKLDLISITTIAHRDCVLQLICVWWSISEIICDVLQRQWNSNIINCVLKQISNEDRKEIIILIFITNMLPRIHFPIDKQHFTFGQRFCHIRMGQIPWENQNLTNFQLINWAIVSYKFKSTA